MRGLLAPDLRSREHDFGPTRILCRRSPPYDLNWGTILYRRFRVSYPTPITVMALTTGLDAKARADRNAVAVTVAVKRRQNASPDVTSRPFQIRNSGGPGGTRTPDPRFRKQPPLSAGDSRYENDRFCRPNPYFDPRFRCLLLSRVMLYYAYIIYMCPRIGKAPLAPVGDGS
jgi:hypothetical protein